MYVSAIFPPPRDEAGPVLRVNLPPASAFLPLSGRERIDLDLGTMKAFGTIQWFTLVT